MDTFDSCKNCQALSQSISAERKRFSRKLTVIEALKELLNTKHDNYLFGVKQNLRQLRIQYDSEKSVIREQLIMAVNTSSKLFDERQALREKVDSTEKQMANCQFLYNQSTAHIKQLEREVSQLKSKLSELKKKKKTKKGTEIESETDWLDRYPLKNESVASPDEGLDLSDGLSSVGSPFSEFSFESSDKVVKPPRATSTSDLCSECIKIVKSRHICEKGLQEIASIPSSAPITEISSEPFTDAPCKLINTSSKIPGPVQKTCKKSEDFVELKESSDVLKSKDQKLISHENSKSEPCLNLPIISDFSNISNCFDLQSSVDNPSPISKAAHENCVPDNSDSHPTYLTVERGDFDSFIEHKLLDSSFSDNDDFNFDSLDGSIFNCSKDEINNENNFKIQSSQNANTFSTDTNIETTTSKLCSGSSQLDSNIIDNSQSNLSSIKELDQKTNKNLSLSEIVLDTNGICSDNIVSIEDNSSTKQNLSQPEKDIQDTTNSYTENKIPKLTVGTKLPVKSLSQEKLPMDEKSSTAKSSSPLKLSKTSAHSNDCLAKYELLPRNKKKVNKSSNSNSNTIKSKCFSPTKSSSVDLPDLSSDTVTKNIQLNETVEVLAYLSSCRTKKKCETENIDDTSNPKTEVAKLSMFDLDESDPEIESVETCSVTLSPKSSKDKDLRRGKLKNCELFQKELSPLKFSKKSTIVFEPQEAPSKNLNDTDIKISSNKPNNEVDVRIAEDSVQTNLEINSLDCRSVASLSKSFSEDVQEVSTDESTETSESSSSDEEDSNHGSDSDKQHTLQFKIPQKMIKTNTNLNQNNPSSLEIQNERSPQLSNNTKPVDLQGIKEPSSSFVDSKSSLTSDGSIKDSCTKQRFMDVDDDMFDRIMKEVLYLPHRLSPLPDPKTTVLSGRETSKSPPEIFTNRKLVDYSSDSNSSESGSEDCCVNSFENCSNQRQVLPFESLSSCQTNIAQKPNSIFGSYQNKTKPVGCLKMKKINFVQAVSPEFKRPKHSPRKAKKSRRMRNSTASEACLKSDIYCPGGTFQEGMNMDDDDLLPFMTELCQKYSVLSPIPEYFPAPEECSSSEPKETTKHLDATSISGGLETLNDSDIKEELLKINTSKLTSGLINKEKVTTKLINFQKRSSDELLSTNKEETRTSKRKQRFRKSSPLSTFDNVGPDETSTSLANFSENECMSKKSSSAPVSTLSSNTIKILNIQSQEYNHSTVSNLSQTQDINKIVECIEKNESINASTGKILDKNSFTESFGFNENGLNSLAGASTIAKDGSTTLTESPISYDDNLNSMHKSTVVSKDCFDSPLSPDSFTSEESLTTIVEPLSSNSEIGRCEPNTLDICRSHLTLDLDLEKYTIFKQLENLKYYSKKKKIMASIHKITKLLSMKKSISKMKKYQLPLKENQYPQTISVNFESNEVGSILSNIESINKSSLALKFNENEFTILDSLRNNSRPIVDHKDYHFGNIYELDQEMETVGSVLPGECQDSINSPADLSSDHTESKDLIRSSSSELCISNYQDCASTDCKIELHEIKSCRYNSPCAQSHVGFKCFDSDILVNIDKCTDYIPVKNELNGVDSLTMSDSSKDLTSEVDLKYNLKNCSNSNAISDFNSYSQRIYIHENSCDKLNNKMLIKLEKDLGESCESSLLQFENQLPQTYNINTDKEEINVPASHCRNESLNQASCPLSTELKKDFEKSFDDENMAISQSSNSWSEHKNMDSDDEIHKIMKAVLYLPSMMSPLPKVEVFSPTLVENVSDKELSDQNLKFIYSEQSSFTSMERFEETTTNFEQINLPVSSNRPVSVAQSPNIILTGNDDGNDDMKHLHKRKSLHSTSPEFKRPKNSPLKYKKLRRRRNLIEIPRTGLEEKLISLFGDSSQQDKGCYSETHNISKLKSDIILEDKSSCLNTNGASVKGSVFIKTPCKLFDEKHANIEKDGELDLADISDGFNCKSISPDRYTSVEETVSETLDGGKIIKIHNQYSPLSPILDLDHNDINEKCTVLSRDTTNKEYVSKEDLVIAETKTLSSNSLIKEPNVNNETVSTEKLINRRNINLAQVEINCINPLDKDSSDDSPLDFHGFPDFQKPINGPFLILSKEYNYNEYCDITYNYENMKNISFNTQTDKCKDCKYVEPEDQDSSLILNRTQKIKLYIRNKKCGNNLNSFKIKNVKQTICLGQLYELPKVAYDVQTIDSSLNDISAQFDTVDIKSSLENLKSFSLSFKSNEDSNIVLDLLRESCDFNISHEECVSRYDLFTLDHNEESLNMASSPESLPINFIDETEEIICNDASIDGNIANKCTFETFKLSNKEISSGQNNSVILGDSNVDEAPLCLISVENTLNPNPSEKVNLDDESNDSLQDYSEELVINETDLDDYEYEENNAKNSKVELNHNSCFQGIGDDEKKFDISSNESLIELKQSTVDDSKNQCDKINSELSQDVGTESVLTTHSNLSCFRKLAKLQYYPVSKSKISAQSNFNNCKSFYINSPKINCVKSQSDEMEMSNDTDSIEKDDEICNSQDNHIVMDLEKQLFSVNNETTVAGKENICLSKTSVPISFVNKPEEYVKINFYTEANEIKMPSETNFGKNAPSIEIVEIDDDSSDELPAKRKYPDSWSIVRQQVKPPRLESEMIQCKTNAFECSLDYWHDYARLNPKPKAFNFITNKDLQLMEGCIMEVINSSSEENILDKIENISCKIEYIDAGHVSDIIVDALYEDTGESDLRFTPPAPPLTPVQRRLFLLVNYLSKGREEYMLTILKALEEPVVSFVDKYCIMKLSNLVKFHTALCRHLGMLTRSRAFLYDILYCKGFKIYPLVYSMLPLWIEILPTSQDSQDCPLTQTIVYLLTYYMPLQKSDIAPYHNGLKQFLDDVYEYGKPVYSRDSLCNKLLDTIRVPGAGLALVLLCKREEWEWASKVMESKVHPIISSWIQDQIDEDTATQAVLCLGRVVRGYPMNVASNSIKRSRDLLESVLNHQKSIDVTEAAVNAICMLRRHDLFSCSIIFTKWRPADGKMTKNMVDNIKTVLSAKQLTYWKKFLSRYN